MVTLILPQKKLKEADAVLTTEQLSYLKRRLLKRQEEIGHLSDHVGQTDAHGNEPVGELSNYDNHPGDMGTELFEREKDIALNDHTEVELRAIHQALEAIKQGTYGYCAVCDQAISFDRLRALPTALCCIEHTDAQEMINDRPVEETILDSNIGRDDREDATMFDAEDSWQEVSKYGSSETPSDFYQTEKTYDDMFFHSDELVGSVEELEGFLLSDQTGKFIGVNQQHEHYEKRLDEYESYLGEYE